VANEQPIPGRVVDRGLRDFLWLLRRRLRGERITEPACRRCGYFVAGLTAPKCPECGADLERNGVIDPARVRWWPLRLAGIAAWTILLALVAFRFGDRIVPRHFMDYGNVVIAGKPDGGPFINIFAHSERYLGWPWTIGSRPVHSIMLIASPSADSQWPMQPMQELTIDLMTGTSEIMTFRIPDASGASAATNREEEIFQGGETILRWLARERLDTSDENVIAKADELLQIIRAAQDANTVDFVAAFRRMPLAQFEKEPSGSGAHYMRTGTRTLMIRLVSIAIWIAGLLLIACVRGRSRPAGTSAADS
jgi:hypothetical protein